MKRRTLLQLPALAGLGWALPALSMVNPEKVLVLLHLKGANDGLNTLVPFESDHYRKLRPNIALTASDVFKVGDSAVGPLGLNQNMRALENSIDQDLAIIPGVGYPNQNRSHFKSIKLWATGSDGNRANRSGWLIDSVERQFDGSAIDLHGASFDGALEVFKSGEGQYLSMARLNQLKGLEVQADMQSGNTLLGLVQHRTKTLATTSKALESKLRSARSLPVRMPYGELSAQLTEVLRVISSDARVPVMHVQLDGFDTHEGQTWRHPRLMEQLAEGLAGFRDNLKEMGLWEQTLVMTYAEFGRRAAENGSQGTDHGTANTHFIMGGSVNGGLYGDHPRLDKLEDGDMIHSMDYRALYDRITTQWWADTQRPWIAFEDARLQSILKA